MSPDEELGRELAFHIQERVRELIAGGMTEPDAQRRARVEFGGVTQVQEDCRDVRRWRLLADTIDDLRFAIRLARRTPMLTVTTLLALTLGIGAASTIFAVINGVLLKPLPYREPSQLTMVWSRSPTNGGRENTMSPADFRDYAQRLKSVERLEGYFAFLSPVEINLANRTEIAYSQVVTSGLFEMLGRQPLLGRTFQTSGDDVPEIVLSQGYWERRFGGDRGVVGRVIRLGALPAAIVGVMPRDVVFPYPGMLGPSGFTRITAPDMWVSMAFAGPMAADQRTINAAGSVVRDVRFLGAIGRRRSGISLEQVRSEATRVAADLESEYPQVNRGWGVAVSSAHDQAIGRIRPALLLLFAGVGLVLLMATTNVANLMLSRSLERRAEYATRVALGASRGRMIRQSLIESLFLAGLGGLAGLAFGVWGIRLLRALAPADLPRLDEITPDWMVGIATIAVAGLVGMVIGLGPAFSITAAGSQLALREHGRGAVGSRMQRRYRTALLIGQVALASVLTIGAGLLLRSFSSVMNVNPGFRPDHLLTWQMNLPDRLKTADERRAFYREFFNRLEAIPGVVSVGGTTRLPLGSTGVTTILEIERRPLPPSSRPEVQFRRALHRYFEAMHIPLRRGRLFNDGDTAAAPAVAVINETMAARVFPGEDPVGQRIRTGSSAPWMEIVGVIGDVRHGGLEEEPAPELYISYLQNPPVAPFIVIRTSVDPSTLASAVRTEAQRIDPDLPLYDMRTMMEVRAGAVAERRFIVWLVTLFGAIALVLAAVGIEGVSAVAVNERMPEMSVRLALGAQPWQLLRLVVSDCARATAFGIGVGLALTWLAMPLIRTQLYGVAPTDLVTMVGVPVLFLTVALVAAFVPARRAANADPARLLRA